MIYNAGFLDIRKMLTKDTNNIRASVSLPLNT